MSKKIPPPPLKLKNPLSQVSPIRGKFILRNEIQALNKCPKIPDWSITINNST